MNKRVLSIAVGAVVLLSTSVFAQVSVQPGITAGLSMFNEKTTSSGGITTTIDTKTGMVAGAVLDIVIMKIFSIEPGILYSMRGGQATDDHGVTTKDNLSYLAIPVHAKLKIPATPVVGAYALAGVNLGILLSAKSTDGTSTDDRKGQFNSTDFGLDFGAGVELSLVKVVPFVEFVYDLGLSNIDKNATGDASTKTSGMELRAGLRFKM
jgi:opacity protein-like surface antigen